MFKYCQKVYNVGEGKFNPRRTQQILVLCRVLVTDERSEIDQLCVPVTNFQLSRATATNERRSVFDSHILKKDQLCVSVANCSIITCNSH